MPEKRFQWTPIRYAMVMIATALGVVFVGDRLIASLPVARFDYARQVDYQLQNYANRTRTPEIVFLGSSTVKLGVNPNAFDERLNALTGETSRSFNLGIGGASALTYLVVGDAILAQPVPPRCIVLCVWPMDVLSDREDARRDTITQLPASVALKDVWPVLDSWELKKGALLSRLFRTRSRWQRWRVAWEHLRGGKPLINDGLVVHENGWFEFTDVSPDRNASDLPDVKGYIETRRKQRTLTTSEFRALAALLDRCAASGTRVLVYGPPIPPSLRTAYRSAYYETYLERVREICARHSIPFVEDVFADARDDDFMDAIHLRPEAATRFSRLLAERVADVLGTQVATIGVSGMTEKRLAAHASGARGGADE
jgi:hypothetical protein